MKIKDKSRSEAQTQSEAWGKKTKVKVKQWSCNSLQPNDSEANDARSANDN